MIHPAIAAFQAEQKLIRKLEREAATAQRRQQRAKTKRVAKRVVKAMLNKDPNGIMKALGVDPDRFKEQVIDTATETGLPLAAARALEVAKLQKPKREMVDTSPAAVAERQAKMVGYLFSGSRVSLARAWRLSGYCRHRASFNQWLASPAVVALVRDAILSGKKMEPRHRPRIMSALRMNEQQLAELVH